MNDHEYAKQFYDRSIPLYDQLEKISQLDDATIANVAEVYSQEANYIEAEAMLWVYQAYKRNPNFHPLFFLNVINRLRIYTPYYCELVLEWARKYKIEQEPANGPWMGAHIAQVLTNSSVQKEFCAKWFLKFLEDMFARRQGFGSLSILSPKVSRAENNVSQCAFKDKNEFESYLEKMGPEYAIYFLSHYYNFSHLYESKDQYLSALNQATFWNGSEGKWQWYGCPQWPDA